MSSYGIATRSTGRSIRSIADRSPAPEELGCAVVVRRAQEGLSGADPVSCGERRTGQLMDPFGGLPPAAQPTVHIALADEASGGEHLAEICAVIGGGAGGSERLEGEGLIAE